MAEIIVGTVASGAGIVSLAIQLVENVKKLRDFYKQVKDAPADLIHILEQLDTLSDLIEELVLGEDAEDIFARSPNLQRCVELCQQSAKELLLLVEKLEKAIGRNRRWGAIVTVLKQDDLVKLDKRLERAMILLTLSFGISGRKSLILEIRRSRVIDTQQNSNQTLSLLPTLAPAVRMTDHPASSTCVEKEVQEMRSTSGTKDVVRRTTSRRIARFRIPILFTRTVWDLEFRRSIRGWDANITFRRVIPANSELFRLAEKADIDGVKALFLNGQASPFDESSDGLTAINVCMSNVIWQAGDTYIAKRKFDFCSFFFNEAGPDYKILMPPRVWCDLDPDSEIPTALYKQLLSHVDYEATSPDCLMFHEGSLESVVQLTANLDQLGDYTLQDRMDLAIEAKSAYTFGTRSMIDAFSARLGCPLDDQRVLEVLFSSSNIYLPGFVDFLGNACAREDQKAPQMLTSILTAGRKQDCLYEGFGKNRGDRGLLEVFVQAYFRTTISPLRMRTRIGFSINRDYVLQMGGVLLEGVRLWASSLEKAGIDLLSHGRVVRNMITSYHQLFEDSYGSYEFDMRGITGENGCFRMMKVVDLTYGHHADDWEPILSWRLDPVRIWEALSGCFWEMLVYDDRTVPGAWDESWDRKDDLEVVIFNVQWRSNFRRYHIPSRGWRKCMARSLAVEMASTLELSPSSSHSLFRTHKIRLAHGTTRKMVDQHDGYRLPPAVRAKARFYSQEPEIQDFDLLRC